MQLKGFTLVEVLVCVGLIAIFIPAIMKALSFSLLESRQGEQYSAAWALAREGMEQKFAQKTSDWTGFKNSGTVTDTKAQFTRAITVSSVARCVNNVICDVGSPGSQPDTGEKITVIVSWPQTGGTQNVTLNAYVTQH